jgi:phosphatidylglycerol:prolipoprotein diacylglycerol transferase
MGGGISQHIRAGKLHVLAVTEKRRTQQLPNVPTMAELGYKGVETDAWYGVAFPNGAPPTTAESLRDFGVAVDPSIPPYQVLKVHPTQLYETFAALVMFGVLMWMNRRPHPKGRVWGAFLILLGIERFLVEFVRAKDDRFFGNFTVAQIISVLLIIAGAVWAARRTPEVVAA